MSTVAKLNNIDHAGLRVAAGRGAVWGEAVNQVPVFPTEFEAVQRDFPIVFHRDEDGAFRALALLGLDRDENLFLDGERWLARYVPALLARGPFSIGVETRPDGGQEPMIYLDLDHPRVAAEGGEPLFLPHGGNTPYLDHVVEVLQVIHVGHAAQTRAGGAKLAVGVGAPASHRRVGGDRA